VDVSSPDAKLTDQLRARLLATAPEEPVELLAELTATAAPPTTAPPTTEPPTTAPPDRAAIIAARRAAFEARLAPLERSVAALGGEVVDHTWLNETLRVRLPAGQVAQLAALDPVERLDLPQPIQPDAGTGTGTEPPAG